MKKNPGAFVSDTRNVGGRQHVIETMLAHQSKLRQIVSESRSNKKSSTSFSSAPATYNLAKKISAQKARKAGRALNEQEKADQSMLRRMDTYPLPGQRRQNINDFTAHPVKLFRDPHNPSLHSTSNGGGNGPLAMPGSPRRLYHTNGFSSDLTAASSSTPLSPRSKTGMAPQTKTAHVQWDVFRPDHFASAQPRTSNSQHGHYKRAALEIMEYSQGKNVTRRAVPTDSHEIEPGSVSPRTMRRRPASAHPRSSMPGQNRDGSWRPLSAGVNPSYARFASEAADDYESLADGSCPAGSSDPYVQLKDKLFALIVEHRIFRARAILKLLEKAKAINAHMNQFKLDRVLEEIKIEFEIAPTARLSDTSPTRAGTARVDRDRDLASKHRELRDLELDLAEERLQGRLDSQQRKLDQREASRGRSRSRSRSQSRSRSHSGSRSGDSRSHSRGDSRSHSRSHSRSRSRSRSPSDREPDSSRSARSEF